MAAIKSDAYGILKHTRIQEEIAKKNINKEDGFFYELSQTKGWDQLKEYIEGITQRLDSLVSEQMGAGATFEDIGRNAVVSQLTKGYLKEIINKVEDAREQVEQSRK